MALRDAFVFGDDLAQLLQYIRRNFEVEDHVSDEQMVRELSETLPRSHPMRKFVDRALQMIDGGSDGASR